MASGSDHAPPCAARRPRTRRPAPGSRGGRSRVPGSSRSPSTTRSESGAPQASTRGRRPMKPGSRSLARSSIDEASGYRPSLATNASIAVLALLRSAVVRFCFAPSIAPKSGSPTNSATSSARSASRPAARSAARHLEGAGRARTASASAGVHSSSPRPERRVRSARRDIATRIQTQAAPATAAPASNRDSARRARPKRSARVPATASTGTSAATEGGSGALAAFATPHRGGQL